MEETLDTEKHNEEIANPSDKLLHLNPKIQRSSPKISSGVGGANDELTNGERHVCSECGTCFISLLKYMDHLNRHTGNKPYVCKECNKQFFTLSYLRNHQKLHSADYQFICEFCGKPFRLKNNLQMHELTHTKEKPFKCDLCEKGNYLSNIQFSTLGNK